MPGSSLLLSFLGRRAITTLTNLITVFSATSRACHAIHFENIGHSELVSHDFHKEKTRIRKQLSQASTSPFNFLSHPDRSEVEIEIDNFIFRRSRLVRVFVFL
jgi:hypothetical protein